MFVVRLSILVAMLAGAALAVADTTPERGPDGKKGAAAAPAHSSEPVKAEAAQKAPSKGDAVLRPAPHRIGGPDLSDIKIDINKINLNLFENTLRQFEKKEGGKELRLSVEDCVRRALAANPDILVAEYEPLKAQADVLAAKGDFDPALRSQAKYTYQYVGVATGLGSPRVSSTTRNISIPPNVSYTTQSSADVFGKLHWGTQYDLALGINRTENTAGRFIEQFSGGLTFTLTQPLLQGGGPNANLARLRIAKANSQISEQQFETTVLSTVDQVVKSYWDLVGGVEQLKVQEEALDNAERLLDINRKRLKIGTAAAIDIVQAKAGVALAQSQLITAHTQVKNFEDILKRALGMEQGGGLSRTAIIPLNRPAVTSVITDEAASLAIAEANRPDIRAAELGIKAAKLQQRQANNALLPSLDVTGSVTQGGHNHYMSKVFSGIVDPLDKGFSVGVTGSISLGNRAARGAYQRAELTTSQAQEQLAKARIQMMEDVRLAVRAVDTSRILVQSNKNNRALREMNLAAEEKRLNLGVSTSYQVLLEQQDLTSAQTAVVQSLIQFEKAVVDLHTAEGTLLKDWGIKFEPTEHKKTLPYFKSLLPKRWR